jgi:serine/threonine protein phosphatase PrpC
LITKANENGGKDNISVMLSRIDSDISSDKSWLEKLAARFN